MNKRLTKISKYMSFILRHQPDAIGLKLDPDGYLVIDDLIKNANKSGKSITVEQLHQVVIENEEQIYELSEDKLRIRAKEKPKRAKRRGSARRSKVRKTEPSTSSPEVVETTKPSGAEIWAQRKTK